MIKKHNFQKYLTESIQKGFSFDVMASIGPGERIDYCYNFLGEPISDGSSRIVFEIDDVQVLKLAYGEMFNAGCAQNKAEFELSRKMKSPLLVKTLYHADDYSWIISERVIACEDIDFYKILGLPYFPYTPEHIADDSYLSNNKKNARL